MLDVGEEALPRLLSVVADVDADLGLGGDDGGGRILHGSPELIGIDRLRRGSDGRADAASDAGRGRLPACVVRMRESLVSTRTV